MGNRASDLLARRAGSRWIEQDYSDAQAVARHIEMLGIGAVVPGCTDVSIETCLKLHIGSEFRDSPETDAALGNKALFRALCEKLDLSSPRTVDHAAFPRAGKFICKPIDAFSGRGITVFDGQDAAALDDALSLARAASPTGAAIIETFASGQLYSCSSFIKNQMPSDTFFVREGTSAHPFAVDTSYVSYDLPASCIEKIGGDIEKLCRALNLKDGLLHVQFILCDEMPMIVEVTRRCPGDLYPLLIEFSTGFEYAACYAAAFLGSEHGASVQTRRHILRHTVTADQDSYFEGLMFTDDVPITAFYPLACMGDALKERQGNRAGILFCEESSEDLLTSLYNHFLNRESYKVATQFK
ncbi:hypothetical protein EP837_02057 [Sphingobium sp. EP60837]|nr:hypothetical protein EP837_02057 [Sphingobium sp. EP60837]